MKHILCLVKVYPYIKYPEYEKEKEKVTEKNKFRAIHFERDENYIPTCPGGHAFTMESMNMKNNEYQIPEIIMKLRNEHCKDCPMRTRCTKAKNGRTVKIDVTLEIQKTKVRRLLTSEEGKEMMKNRSIQSEGAFGILKENYGFDCLSRRGESGVKIEGYSASIGYNIRKYHKAKLKKEEAIKATKEVEKQETTLLS